MGATTSMPENRRQKARKIASHRPRPSCHKGKNFCHKAGKNSQYCRKPLKTKKDRLRGGPSLFLYSKLPLLARREKDKRDCAVSGRFFTAMPCRPKTILHLCSQSKSQVYAGQKQSATYISDSSLSFLRRRDFFQEQQSRWLIPT